MPGRKIFMNLGLNRPNYGATQVNKANLATAPKPPTVLNAPMISRIHNVQPGCGACGRSAH
jgi:hypothetical protein